MNQEPIVLEPVSFLSVENNQAQELLFDVVEDRCQLISTTVRKPTPIGISNAGIAVSPSPHTHITIIGLTKAHSAAAALRLVQSDYSCPVNIIDIEKIIEAESLIDSLIQAKPDLIIITGGTEKGANLPVKKVIDVVANVCEFIPEGMRPEILYCGNSEHSHYAEQSLSKFTRITFTSNIFPQFGEITPNTCHETLAGILSRVTLRNEYGYEQPANVQRPITTKNWAFSLSLSLSKEVNIYGDKPILGLLAAENGLFIAKTGMRKNDDFGFHEFISSETMIKFLEKVGARSLVKWIPGNISEEKIKEFLVSTGCRLEHSSNIEEQTIRLALVNEFILMSLQLNNLRNRRMNILDAIILQGSLFLNFTQKELLLAQLLEAIQPVGFTQFMIDDSQVLIALGTLARTNPGLFVQLSNQRPLVNLAAVVSPIIDKTDNSASLEMDIEDQRRVKVTRQIRGGLVSKTQVAFGEEANIKLRMMRGSRLSSDQDPHEEIRKKISGGICGVVIDTRGRHIRRSESIGDFRKRIIESLSVISA